MRPRIICIILGGGRGSRLYPLTQPRCKPAVPLAGKYRLVDIPISNCLNSGLNEIYVLTQFNTASLHRHIQAAYSFDPFSGGLVDILSAEQTERGDNWYQGTADAVRQNLMHFNVRRQDLVLILSGDQLYRMDFRTLIDHHKALGSDATVAATPISEEHASAFGLMQVNDDFSVKSFVEKPKEQSVIDQYMLSSELLRSMNRPESERLCLVSMGIYLFNASVLIDALDSECTDFGKEVIPGLLGKAKLNGYVFDDYWEDIGTVKAFFEANLRLTDPNPPFDFLHPTERVYTRARFLPASVITNSKIGQAIVADGCVLHDVDIERSVIGVRSLVGKNTRLSNVVMMGNDFYEEPEDLEEATSKGIPPCGIGENCDIEHAIVDKNARIGKNVKLSPKGKDDNTKIDGITIRDGVLIVPKDGVVPDGTVI